jgi:hypothetical protein
MGLWWAEPLFHFTTGATYLDTGNLVVQRLHQCRKRDRVVALMPEILPPRQHEQPERTSISRTIGTAVNVSAAGLGESVGTLRRQLGERTLS